MTDDVQLMEQVGSGSADAFGDLYDRYRGRAYRVARSVCYDTGHAEDAVQEAFVSLWRTRAAYNPQRGTVAAWVLTTVRYRAIDVARRNGARAAEQTGDAADDCPAPGDVAERAITRADAARLQALLEQLPDAQREVIALAFYGELSHSEIAAHLGLPAGTVKGRMRLGLEKLRGGVERIVA